MNMMPLYIPKNLINLLNRTTQMEKNPEIADRYNVKSRHRFPRSAFLEDNGSMHFDFPDCDT